MLHCCSWFSAGAAAGAADLACKLCGGPAQKVCKKVLCCLSLLDWCLSSGRNDSMRNASRPLVSFEITRESIWLRVPLWAGRAENSSP